MLNVVLAVIQACCHAVVCTAGLISQECALPAAVLHCTVAVSMCKPSTLTLQQHEPPVRHYLHRSSDQSWMHFASSSASVLYCWVIVWAVSPQCAVTQAVVCTAGLISKGCTLPKAVLQCTVAGHCPSSKCLNLTLQRHESAVRPSSAQQL